MSSQSNTDKAYGQKIFVQPVIFKTKKQKSNFITGHFFMKGQFLQQDSFYDRTVFITGQLRFAGTLPVFSLAVGFGS